MDLIIQQIERLVMNESATHKDAEDALRASEAEFRTLAEFGECVVWGMTSITIGCRTPDVRNTPDYCRRLTCR